jgi:hypothetical protein
MANFHYNKARALYLGAGLDWNGSTIRALLVTSGYTANPDHSFVSSITNECTGTYSRLTLTGKSIVQNDTSNRAEAHCDPLVWEGLVLSSPAAALILYKFVTNDADSPLIAYIDTPTPSVFPFTSIGGDVSLAISGTGIIRV